MPQVLLPALLRYRRERKGFVRARGQELSARGLLAAFSLRRLEHNLPEPLSLFRFPALGGPSFGPPILSTVGSRKCDGGRPVVCFVNVNNRAPDYLLTFQRFNLEWKTHTPKAIYIRCVTPYAGGHAAFPPNAIILASGNSEKQLGILQAVVYMGVRSSPSRGQPLASFHYVGEWLSLVEHLVREIVQIH
jgi:hypothetical protein